METMNNECPTDVLIDIKEDEKYLSCRKEGKASLSNVKLMTKMDSSSIEENKSLKSIDRYETILDISPSRICGEFNKRNIVVSEIDLEQSLKSEIAGGCPTAVLINVSPPTGFCSRDVFVSCRAQYFKDELNGCKTLNIENHESKDKTDKSSNYVNDDKTEGSQSSSNSSEVENQVTVKRLHWKTPSPKSMSRISKEASKIIDNLHCSSIFDEDLLLTEEILPVTLNFDELDDDTDLGSSCDSINEDVILNNLSSVGEQSLNKIEKINEKLNVPNSDSLLKVASDKFQGTLTQTLVETNLTEVSFQVSSENDNNSKESYSSGIHSNSLDNSGSLRYGDEADDVFTVAHIISEDKENVQNKVISSKKNKVGSKTASKNLSMNGPKLDQRGTLKNLSNIKQEASSKRLSLSVNKNVTTSLKRMSISANKKGTVHQFEKPQIKKTALTVDYHSSVKSNSQSKSFQFQNTAELTSSAQKSRPTIRCNTGCSSLSSDVRKQNVFPSNVTPSRRYSICTPLKSASAIKPPLTPAMTSSHNFVFPKYTPQPSRPPRLSFSRSWQQSGDNCQFFPAKGLKQQVSIRVPSTVSNSSKPVKRPFSQSMSSVPLRSTGKSSSKGRFSNKVPSPLSLEKDKKVVRALFSSVSRK